MASLDRRDFLKGAAMAGLGSAFPPSIGFAEASVPDPEAVVREGYRSLAGRLHRLLVPNIQRMLAPDEGPTSDWWVESVDAMRRTGSILDAGFHHALAFGSMQRRLVEVLPRELLPDSGDRLLSDVKDTVMAFLDMGTERELLAGTGIDEIVVGNIPGRQECGTGKTVFTIPYLDDRSAQCLVNGVMAIYDLSALKSLHSAMRKFELMLGSLYDEGIVDSLLDTNGRFKEAYLSAKRDGCPYRLLADPELHLALGLEGRDLAPYREFVETSLPLLDFLSSFRFGHQYIGSEYALGSRPRFQESGHAELFELYSLLFQFTKPFESRKDGSLPFVEVGCGLVEREQSSSGSKAWLLEPAFHKALSDAYFRKRDDGEPPETRKPEWRRSFDCDEYDACPAV